MEFTTIEQDQDQALRWLEELSGKAGGLHALLLGEAALLDTALLERIDYELNRMGLLISMAGQFAMFVLNHAAVNSDEVLEFRERLITRFREIEEYAREINGLFDQQCTLADRMHIHSASSRPV